MSRRVRPAVKALIEREGKLLALKAELEQTYWLLPGGKVEYGEPPEEALKRELREEIGAEADIGETVGMYHFFQGSNNDGDQVVLTAFEAEIGEQDIDISNNPAEEYITDHRWMTPEDLVEKTDNKSLEKLIRENYIEKRS